MFLPPLFKIVNNDVSIGGGIKISKYPPNRFRASPELRVDTGRNVTVTYDLNVRDVYGVEIVDMDIEQDTNTSVLVQSRGYDNFVNVSNPELRCVLVVLRTGEYNLQERSLVSLLTEMGTPMSLRLEDPNTTLSVRSELIVNHVNDNRSIRNRSRLYSDTPLKKAFFSTGATSQYLDTDRLQMFPMYGPYKYDVVTVLNDANLTYTTMKRSLFVHGVYDVTLKPTRTTGIQTGVNLDDSIKLTWKSSQPEMVGITLIQIRDAEGNVLAESTEDSFFTISLSDLSDYRGELRGYVQYENVSWSPYNYSNSLVFETSNVPVRIEFRVSNDERYDIGFDELYIQLTLLDLGSIGNTSVLVRTITVRLYEDEARTVQAGTTVSFTSLYESKIVRNLRVATAYYMSYESNDELNPAYSDVIDAQYSTRVDPSFVSDTDGPEIDVQVMSVRPILFNAVITDVSFLVKVQFALFSDLELTNVTTYQQWTPIPINDLRTQMNVINQEVFVYYKDNTNVQPFLVSTSTFTKFRLVLQAIDINNNITTITQLIELD